MDHHLHQYQHTYKTRAQVAHSPMLIVWGCEIATRGPKWSSPLTERLFGHKAQLGVMTLPLKPVGLNLTEGRQFHPFWSTSSLHTDGSFQNMCCTSWSRLFFKHSMPVIHSIQFNLEQKYMIVKTHSTNRLDNENRVRVSKNTTWTAL